MRMLTERHPAHLVQRCAGSKIIGRLTDVVEGGLDSASSSVCARELHCAGSVRGARCLGGMARGKVLRAAHKTGTTNYFKCTAQHTFKCKEFVSATADHMLVYPCNTRIEVKETFARRWAAGGATAKKFMYSSNRHFYQSHLR